MRTYRVLAQTPLDETYKVVGDIEASSAEQAIRAAATQHGDGRYVAVPDRSWNESGAKREVRVVLTDVVADTDEDDEDETETTADRFEKETIDALTDPLDPSDDEDATDPLDQGDDDEDDA